MTTTEADVPQPIRRQSQRAFTNRSRGDLDLEPGFGLFQVVTQSDDEKMFLFPRNAADCPYMPTCCFLLTEDEYQQFTISSGPLRKARTFSRNPKYSRGKKTIFRPQPLVRSSCRLWTLPDDATDADVEDLRLSPLRDVSQQSWEKQKVPGVSSGPPSATLIFTFRT